MKKKLIISIVLVASSVSVTGMTSSPDNSISHLQPSTSTSVSQEGSLPTAPMPMSLPAATQGGSLPTAPMPMSIPATHEELLAIDRELTMNRESPPTITRGWWEPMVASSFRPGAAGFPLSLEEVMRRTLCNSKQVKVFSELPLIRETAIGEAAAAFDWAGFLETRWDDLSDPVGSTLTTGGANRYRNHDFSFSGGVKKHNRLGGDFEMAQEFGLQNTNSRYFVPNDQGTARLAVRYTQPLLRGAGRQYNTSLIVLAQIDRNASQIEFRRQLESHLLEVTRAYWSIYLERASLCQQLNAFRQTATIVRQLELRQSLDTTKSQLVIAQASMAQRRAKLVRARSAVTNAESRLRALVNDPNFADDRQVELIPMDVPSAAHVPVDRDEAKMTAIQFRPEAQEALKRIKAAGVRLNMSKNELLPALNLVMEAYVSGLEGDSQIGEAWTRQFDSGEPGYSVGLRYEVPFGNRAAKFRHFRRRHELRQLQHQYASTLETITLEVQLAVKEIDTSYEELSAKGLALLARQNQLETLTKRWKQLPGEDVASSLALENLLLAQDRLVEAEHELLRSQLSLSLSLTNLQKATGRLLQQENVTIGRFHGNGLSTQVISK